MNRLLPENEVQGIRNIRDLHDYIRDHGQATIKYASNAISIVDPRVYNPGYQGDDIFLALSNDGDIQLAPWGALVEAIRMIKQASALVPQALRGPNIYNSVLSTWNNKKAKKLAFK